MAPTSVYETVALFGRQMPTHVSDAAKEDQLRLRAYDTYTELYQNNAEAFAAVLKLDSGNELFRRLIASSRTIVEASNRYFGRGLSWIVEPGQPTSSADAGGVGGEGAAASEPDGGAAAAEAAAGVLGPQGILTNLFRREEFGARYMSMKRWSLVRGDGMFHITADPSKPEGQRLSITELNPAAYFPIKDPANEERVVGCYIVNVILDDEEEEIVARLEYRRILTAEDAANPDLAGNGGLNTVFAKLTFWEPDGWDARYLDKGDMKPVSPPARFGAAAADAASPTALLLAGSALPSQITAIPVYHFRNNRRGGTVFGVSELQGIETLITGVNQTVTDQELAVALNGLGLYWTDSGQAKDEQGNAIPYRISPGSMLSLEQGGKIGRLTGVDSISASKGHAEMLQNAMQEASGTPAVAIGRPNNTSAESGVALAIEMSPVVSKGEEKEEEHLGRLTQMNFDLLTGWLPAYEGYTDDGTRVLPVFDDPVPVDRAAVVTEVTGLVTAKIISARSARDVVAEKLGYQFGPDEDSRLAGEAQAALDLEGARLESAVGDTAPAPGAGTAGAGEVS
jgi:hypothetical protein